MAGFMSTSIEVDVRKKLMKLFKGNSYNDAVKKLIEYYENKEAGK